MKDTHTHAHTIDDMQKTTTTEFAISLAGFVTPGDLLVSSDGLGVGGFVKLVVR